MSHSSMWPPLGDRMPEKLSITEFLLARIAEDEAAAQPFPGAADQRALRECAAKRAIIGLADDVETIDDALMIETASWKWETSDKILRALAAVYSDHPDYQSVWSMS